LNGQAERRRAIERLVEVFEPAQIVETGTFHGASAAFFAGFGIPVFTIELRLENVLVSKRRLRSFANVTLIRGDSVAGLDVLAREGSLSRPLAYLDAHWHGRLPLIGEISVLLSKTSEGVIVIDDFMVEDDPGYGYDTYEGRPISLDLLELPDDVAAAYPAAASMLESGERRGTLYLGYGKGAVDTLGSLVTEGLLRFARRVDRP
jgi:predicted O-methyltransferase YrrM